MGPGYPERECEVGGRPESKLARGSCFGVRSPAIALLGAKGNLRLRKPLRPATIHGASRGSFFFREIDTRVVPEVAVATLPALHRDERCFTGVGRSMFEELTR